MSTCNRFFSAVGFAAFFAAAGCGDNPAAELREPEESLVEAVRAMGLRTDMIEDHGSFLLVEGDIYLPKGQLRSFHPQRSGDPLRPRFQYVTTNRVSRPKINQIQVDLSGLNSQTAWQSAARDAIAYWSGIANSYVKIVEGSPADITVSTTCTSSNVAAYASFPSGGNPGSTIYVNTCFGYSTTDAQKVHNMVHEFGHTIGFRHSNYVQMGESAGSEGANHIWGTPTSGNDAGSVMNGGTALNSWAGFSAYDASATAAVYSLPAPIVTVTNSSGIPQVTWNAIPGVTEYTVNLIVHVSSSYGWYETYDGVQSSEELGTTTDTSLYDGYRSYTNLEYCTAMVQNGSGAYNRYRFEYEVVAHFDNGTSRGSAFPARVAPYYCYV
jgi:hypothetical protein